MNKSFYRWLDKTFLPGETAILMYHGLTDNDEFTLENYHGKHLHISKLEEHLRFLQKNYSIISLNQFVLQQKNKAKTLGPSVAITFDDGYESNYTLGFPLFKKLQVPVTIFLATDFMDHKSFFWANRIEFAILNTSIKKLEIQECSFNFDLTTTESRQTAINTLKNIFKSLPSEIERLNCIAQIEQQLKIHLSFDNTIPFIHRPMNWDQAREMNDSGLITFGSHTCSHVILAQCRNEELTHELSDSKKRIEHELKTNCDFFCYPYGGAGTFNKETASAVQKVGYLCALTTVTGTNNKTSHPYYLKRLGTSNLYDWSHFENNLLVSRKKIRTLRKKLSALFK